MNLEQFHFCNRIDKNVYYKKRQYYQELQYRILRKAEDLRENSTANTGEKVLFTDYTVLSINGDEIGLALKRGKNFYRGIYNESLEKFNYVWKKGILQALAEYKIIPHLEITNFYTDDFPIIVRTETVTISRPDSWSFLMIKDACILIACLKNILNACGCTLLDGHLNNITFHNGHPMFLDIGSIIPLRESGFQEETVFTGCFHLLCLQLGNSMLSRMNLCDIDNNNFWLLPRNYGPLMTEYRFCIRRMRKIYRIKSNRLGRRLFREVFILNCIAPESLDLLFPCFEAEVTSNYDACLEDLYLVIEKKAVDAATITDVGGTGGKVIKNIIQNTRLSSGVYIDGEERLLDLAYSRHTPQLYTYLVNYIYPYDSIVLQNIQADVVLCIDPTANTKSFQKFDISTVFKKLCSISNKYIVIVFYPNHPIHPLLRIDSVKNNFTDWFETKFKSSFKMIFYKKASVNHSSEDYFIIYVGETL